MTQHAWEIVGCILVLALFIAAVLALGHWIDDQGEPEWWGNEE